MVVKLKDVSSLFTALALIALTLPAASGKLAPSTTSPSGRFSSYNIYVDTSQAGTERTLRQLNEAPSPSSTEPSLQDTRDFSLLKPKEVYFNGQAGIRATRD